MNVIVLTGGVSSSLTAYAPDTPRAGWKATRRARCSGLTPALSRLRGTYALTRSGGGVRSRWPLTSTPSAHRREVGGQHRGHVLRPACRYALCGLSMNPALLVMPWTQRQAARGRAGSPRRARGLACSGLGNVALRRALCVRSVEDALTRCPFRHTPALPPGRKVRLRHLATLFGLPATLRAGTESVLFPWRCFLKLKFGLTGKPSRCMVPPCREDAGVHAAHRSRLFPTTIE